MSERTPTNQQSDKQIEEEEKDHMATPDMHNTGMRIERAREVYRTYSTLGQKPSQWEIWAWYLYGLGTYFIHTALIPIVFPLIISQIVSLPPQPAQGWDKSDRGFLCRPKEMQLYEQLTHRSISVNDLKFSPLEWTSISWAIGLILSSPVLSFISIILDLGHKQKLIAGAATTIGSFFCLPVGLFRVTWIFPIYIAAIVIASTVATACHTRHHGLIVRGFTGPTIQKTQFQTRRGVSSWLSVYATAIGCLGSAVISSFSFHMLRQKDTLMGLWIVSILGGLKWLTGIFYVLTVRPGPSTTTSSTTSKAHNILSIFKYYHAFGSLIGISFASFTSMCIFTGAVLHLVGQLCLKPVVLLYLWLIYFILPSFSMPLLQPLQHALKMDSVKMQLLGFLLSLFTSGMGFYFQDKKWSNGYILFFAALQSTSTGILHAFGQVLLLDCTPPGKESVFATWFSGMKGVGTCAGFAVASFVVPRNVGTSFGISFCTSFIGLAVFIFGNISDLGGAIAAGHVSEDSERESPENGLDATIVIKEPMRQEIP